MLTCLPPCYPHRHGLLVILSRVFLGHPVDRETDTLLEEVTHLTTLIPNYVSQWAQLTFLMIQKRVSREALPDLSDIEIRAPRMSKCRCCKNWTTIKLKL